MSQSWPGTLTFSYDPSTNSVTSSSPNALEVLGVSQQHLSVHGALFLAYVHPADRFTTETLLDAALRDGTPYIATYRWTRPDTNEVRFIHCRAHTDPRSGSFEGVMIDITSEAPRLRGEGDIALATGTLLHQMGLPGITLDLELTIRSVVKGSDTRAISFGTEDLDYALIKPGANLLDCFTSSTSRNYAHSLLEKALNLRGENVEVMDVGSRTIIRSLLSENIAQGLVVFSLDSRGELEANKRAEALQHELKQLEAARERMPAIAAATQEIAGYGALITRHSRGNPLLAAISDSLIQSVRELAQTADSLGASGSSQQLSTSKPSHTRPAPSSMSRSIAKSPPHVIFASNSKRCATSHALLLRESGIACATATLEEAALFPLLKLVERARILIIDAPPARTGVTSLIRKIRRKHPNIHIACLVAPGTDDHQDLLRAGAISLLTKPAPAEEIERVVKLLSSLAPVAAPL